MDSDTRNNYPQFSADWKNLGYDNPPQAPNLTTKIHPIFEKSNGIDRGFLGTDKEYEMIRPAIQLASNYLYSPRSCLFIYSLVYADRKPIATTFGYGDVPITFRNLEFKTKYIPCTEFRRLDNYCPKKMNHIWEQLALYNVLGPEEIDDAGGTVLIPGDGADMRGDGCRGSRTYITFNRYFLRDIEKLTHSGQVCSLQMLNLQYALAITLCHEVAHAVVRANDYRLRKQMKAAETSEGTYVLDHPVEPFFEDQCTAEIGYSWESETIGGELIAPPPGASERFSSIVDWPHGDCFGDEQCRKPSPQRGPPMKQSVDGFVVDMNYVQMVFRQDFWDKLARLPTAEDRGLALIIPRTVGYCMNHHKYTEEEKKKFTRAQYDEYMKLRFRRVVWKPAEKPQRSRAAISNSEPFQKIYRTVASWMQIS